MCSTLRADRRRDESAHDAQQLQIEIGEARLSLRPEDLHDDNLPVVQRKHRKHPVASLTVFDDRALRRRVNLTEYRDGSSAQTGRFRIGRRVHDASARAEHLGQDRTECFRRAGGEALRLVLVVCIFHGLLPRHRE
ncbi:hypothetical protein [Caballeronia cordobensis]|uniref:hypothetical protein n=1 Tax=Caballeronia cordobensis TaxID=1353886 RepID=UPI00118646D8